MNIYTQHAAQAHDPTSRVPGCMTEPTRERERGRGRSRLHPGSLRWDSISGLQDHTPGCRWRQTAVPPGLPLCPFPASHVPSPCPFSSAGLDAAAAMPTALETHEKASEQPRSAEGSPETPDQCCSKLSRSLKSTASPRLLPSTLMTSGSAALFLGTFVLHVQPHFHAELSSSRVWPEVA